MSEGLTRRATVWRRLRDSCRRWAGNCRGGMATSFALSLPVLLAILGVASDYAMMSQIRGELQQTADAAALAGAREIPLAMSKAEQVISAVEAFATYELAQNADTPRETILSASVNDDFTAVHVNISKTWSPFFAHFIVSGITPVKVEATARYVGRNNVCVLGLAESRTGVLLDRNATLTGNNCGLFSNAPTAKSMTIDFGATVKASIICAAGGVDVSGSATADPAPISDCPPLPDPLADRAPPPFEGCDHTALAIKDETVTLDPGVYCGGLTVAGLARVTLNPGEYIIKDGQLVVSGQATFNGEGVGFFLTGNALPFHFSAKTHIALTAPESGPLAGLLFFEDRGGVKGMKHRISSNDARVLLGTIYLPVGDLVIDAQDPVADQSAFTAIVTQSLDLNMGPNLVLNADYDMTDVPVPAGIAGSSQVILSN